jgi:hypothetical protein
MSDLVTRLCSGVHPAELTLRPERTAQALQRRFDEYGFVHIRFTDTQGGTELGIELEKSACDLSRADFAHGAGAATLVGRLTLDYVPLRCVAHIDLATCSGDARLEHISDTTMPAAAAVPLEDRGTE